MCHVLVKYPALFLHLAVKGRAWQWGQDGGGGQGNPVFFQEFCCTLKDGLVVSVKAKDYPCRDTYPVVKEFFNGLLIFFYLVKTLSYLLQVLLGEALNAQEEALTTAFLGLFQEFQVIGQPAALL